MKPILNLKKLALDKDKFIALEQWINAVTTYQTPFALTDQATINWNVSSAYNTEVTLASSRERDGW